MEKNISPNAREGSEFKNERWVEVWDRRDGAEEQMINMPGEGKIERIDGRADGTEQESREPRSRSEYTIGVKGWQPQNAAHRVSNSRWRDRRSRKKRHGTIQCL